MKDFDLDDFIDSQADSGLDSFSLDEDDTYIDIEDIEEL